MACPGGSEHDSLANDGVNLGSDCTGNCWATGANVKSDTNNNYNNGGEETREDGIYEDHDEDWVKEQQENCTSAGSEAVACADNCINGCANCSGQCGSNCTSGCSGGCSGCSGGCSGSCDGSCSGKCTGTCKGNCTGGCQGSCKTACNIGCTSQEQVDNVTDLERIVRAPNIKKIFRFLIYELERRRAYKVPQEYKDGINQLTGWKKEQEEILMALRYTIPRIFENIFKDIIKESFICQSYSLESSNNFRPYYPQTDNYTNEPSEISLAFIDDYYNNLTAEISEEEKKYYYNKLNGSSNVDLPSSFPKYLEAYEDFKNLWASKYSPDAKDNHYYNKNNNKNNNNNNNNNENNNNNNDNDNNNDNNTNISKEPIGNYYYAYKPAAEIWVKKAHELYNEMIGIKDAK